LNVARRLRCGSRFFFAIHDSLPNQRDTGEGIGGFIEVPSSINKAATDSSGIPNNILIALRPLLGK
jgi:hypothetical protein